MFFYIWIRKCLALGVSAALHCIIMMLFCHIWTLSSNSRFLAILRSIVQSWTHIILWGSTHVAALALYALPAVRLHSSHHYGSELQTGRVACVKNDVYHFMLQPLPLFQLQELIMASLFQRTNLNDHSQSRTPALLTGQFCDWFWSLPGRSHSNY